MDRYKALDGFEIAGCAVRRWNIIAFWGQKWDNPDPLEARPTRVFFYYPDEPPGKQWAYRDIGSARGIRGCGAKLPQERWVFVADDGAVYVIGGGADGFEEPIVEEPFTFFSNVKQIDPGFAYAVGPRRKVFVRESPDSWRRLSSGLSPDESGSAGFSDIDGFDQSDLYACGGKGDLWRFDGRVWLRVDVPTNQNMWKLCCAADGLVYVLAGKDTIVVGRGESWNVIRHEDGNSRIESVVSYGGKTIVSTGESLLELAGPEIQPASLGKMPAMKSCSFLAAGDGVLVVAGGNSACRFDGSVWSTIIAS